MIQDPLGGLMAQFHLECASPKSTDRTKAGTAADDAELPVGDLSDYWFVDEKVKAPDPEGDASD